MPSDREIARILEDFPQLTSRRITPLGSAGGFSGAMLWRIECDQGEFCLRRWPREHPSRQRLNYIHAFLQYVTRMGFNRLPLPVATRAGATVFTSGGFYWQVEPWLAGAADYHDCPRGSRLKQALQALAELHQAAVGFESAVGPPPGLEARARQFAQLDDVRLQRLQAGLATLEWPEFRLRGVQVLSAYRQRASAAQALVTAALQRQVPLQVCLRDIWHDHVLFVGDEVSGFIDFGAIRQDHVAADISRLLGSLVGDDPSLRSAGLAAYCTVRQLSEDELQLVEAYDRSSTLLSGINWLQWVCLDRRSFEQPRLVLQRLDAILARLPAEV